jgi:hypothetical protein
MANSWFEKRYADPAEQLAFQQERAVVEATEAILKLMEQQGKTKADIANALSTSKAHVSQALGGGRNMTIRTLASLAWACGSSLRGFQFCPLDQEVKLTIVRPVFQEQVWQTQADEMATQTVEAAPRQALAAPSTGAAQQQELQLAA